MGSPIFAAMVRLNCASTARIPLPSMPSTEITNGENFLLIVTVITVLIFLDSFPPIYERRHWLILVGIRVRIAKFHVNDGVRLLIP